MNPGASSFSLVGHIIKNKKEKPDRKKKQRSDDHHFFFHLIVLLQENDEKKKDDRDLSLDSFPDLLMAHFVRFKRTFLWKVVGHLRDGLETHHWQWSSSCWPINKEKKRWPTGWRWRQWWLLFDRLKALLSQEKIKEKVGQAVSVSRAYCGPQEKTRQMAHNSKLFEHLPMACPTFSFLLRESGSAFLFFYIAEPIAFS